MVTKDPTLFCARTNFKTVTKSILLFTLSSHVAIPIDNEQKKAKRNLPLVKLQEKTFVANFVKCFRAIHEGYIYTRFKVKETIYYRSQGNHRIRGVVTKIKPKAEISKIVNMTTMKEGGIAVRSPSTYSFNLGLIQTSPFLQMSQQSFI